MTQHQLTRRLLLLGAVMAASAGVMWYFRFAGMPIGALGVFVVVGVEGAWVALLLLRRSSRFPVILGAVLAVSGVLAALVAVSPTTHDRLLAAFPPEAVPAGAQERGSRTSGSAVLPGVMGGHPSVVRWYEVPGTDDAVIERQIRHALKGQGWRLEPPFDSFDFTAVDPAGQVDAQVTVGLQTPKQRSQSGDRPMPRSEGNTMVEVSLSECMLHGVGCQ